MCEEIDNYACNNVMCHLIGVHTAQCVANHGRRVRLERIDTGTEDDRIPQPVVEEIRKREWPDPTPEMLNDVRFNAVWELIKTWDIHVPGAYVGYTHATGNHVRAILDALEKVEDVGASTGTADDHIPDEVVDAMRKRESKALAFAEPLLEGWREAVTMLEDFCSEPVRLKNMLAAADQIDEFKKMVRALEEKK